MNDVIVTLDLPPGAAIERSVLTGQGYEISATGWGPSLHRMRYLWSVQNSDSLHVFASIQRERYRRAQSLGFSMQPGDGIVDHMLIDRVLLGYDPSVLDRFRRLVEYMQGQRYHGNETTISKIGISIEEKDDLIRPTGLVRVDTPWGRFNGKTLVFKAQLPMTLNVSALAKGRPLGDLVSIDGPGYDRMQPLLRRTILEMHQNASHVTLVFEPDWVDMR